MSQVYTIGRVTADFELKMSQQMNPYVRFSIAENIGYGQNAKAQFLQVWARKEHAENLIKAHVKKGSLIWVSGSVELEEFMKKDATTLDKRLKIELSNWGFVAVGKPKSDTNSQTQLNGELGGDFPSGSIPSGGEIDGNREELP